MKPFQYYLNLISNLIIILFILLGVICFFIGATYFDPRLLWSYFTIIIPLICVLVGGSLFFINPGLKHNISTLIFFSYATLYIVNLYLEPNLEKTAYGENTNTTLTDLALLNGVEWDTRSIVEVVRTLGKTKSRVFANTVPAFLRNAEMQNTKRVLLASIPKADQTIFPLGGISRAHIVMCNEAGKWISFESDRFGFNNNDNVYENNPGDRIVLLGDSFTQGFCVEAEDSLAGQLRSKGHNVINLGSGGNGPLTELALLKEYAVNFKPKYIFWVYNDTDLMDLRHEYETGFLENYLEDNFSQNLIDRQQEIDLFWETLLARETAAYFKNLGRGLQAQGDGFNLPDEKYVSEKLKDLEDAFDRGEVSLPDAVTISAKTWLKDESLYHFRTKVTLHNIRRYFSLSRKHFIDLEPVLMRAKTITDELGIKLYFIRIPLNYNDSMTREEFSFRYQVIAIAKKLGIPVIDFEKHLKEKKDYLAFFQYRIGTHYNKKGYSLLAEVIEQEVFN